jgi:hypothetical protein
VQQCNNLLHTYIHQYLKLSLISAFPIIRIAQLPWEFYQDSFSADFSKYWSVDVQYTAEQMLQVDGIHQ